MAATTCSRFWCCAWKTAMANCWNSSSPSGSRSQPVTLIEMVAAYGTIANGGNYLQPFLVLRVEDRNGQLLEQFEPVREQEPAMPRAQALTLVNVMRGVID